LATLPQLTSNRVRLPDVPEIVEEFALLERRPGANGHDKVDARGNRPEDLANCIAGAVWLLSAPITGAEAWLQFMRWQLHGVPEHVRRPDYVNPDTDLDAIRAAGPQFGFQFENQPVFTLSLPGDLQASHIQLPNGQMKMVDCDQRGHRTITVDADAARVILNSGTESSARWFSVNEGIAVKLGPLPPPPPSVRVTDFMDAQESARPRSIFDKNAISRDTLAMYGRKI